MVVTEKGMRLARVTIIDFEFNKVMDELVKPKETITNYNTQFSGITEELLQEVTTSVEDIQLKLSRLISKDTILIGHSLENDLRALEIIHDKVIDTSVLFSVSNGRKLKLKELSAKHFNSIIQKDEHDSMEDAKAALSLAKFRVEICSHIKSNFFNKIDVRDFDILRLITENKKTVLPLDKEQNIQEMIKYGAHFDVIQNDDFSTIMQSL